MKPQGERPDKAQKAHAPNYDLPPTFLKPCVMKVNGAFFGGKSLGFVADVDTHVLALRAVDMDSHLALLMHFPLTASAEDSGFGKIHTINSMTRRPEPCNFRKLKLRFPRDIEIAYREASQEDTAMCPSGKPRMVWVDVTMRQGVITVEGFGMPYFNPGHPSESWLRNMSPAVDDLKLLDLVHRKHFSLLVCSPEKPTRSRWNVSCLAPTFDYGYGTNHHWSEAKALTQLDKIRGHQFQAAFSHPTDTSHVTAVTQSLVQDVAWLIKASNEMADERLPAYFVRIPAKVNIRRRYFVVVRTSGDFWGRYNKAWARFTKSADLKLRLHVERAENWHARVLDRPDFLGPLTQHHLQENDLVLEALPVSMSTAVLCEFETRNQADAATESRWNRISLHWDLGLHEFKRKVEAVCQFLPKAAPSNLHFGGPSNDKELAMMLHRDLLRGEGFYNTMVRSASSATDIESSMKKLGLNNGSMRLQTLPSVNFLDGPDAKWVDSLMMEALEQDRHRLRRHLSHSPLGLVVITAGPGFGKTTAAAVVVLAMHASLGKVLASGPTNVAVNNLCDRISVVSNRVTDRYNSDRERASRRRRPLVLRGFRLDNEHAAFNNLLKNLDLGNNAAPFVLWGAQLKWKLQFSATYWLLMCLGSCAVPALHDDDSKALHNLRHDLNRRSDMASLRKRVAGKITWDEYVNSSRLTKAEFETLVGRLIKSADILCTIPALAESEPNLSDWKVNSARAIAIDEAGNMSRGDLCSIWGNTLLPCLLAGDDKQLAPVVITSEELDADGNSINRFGPDGRISALEFVMGSGWPVYRLRTQLRMARGQFDICRATVYSDVNSSYSPGSDISLPAHRTGRVLEEYIRVRFPDVTSPEDENLVPLFVSCKNSTCIVDPVTRSKRNFDQIRIALEFCVDFVQTKKISPADLLIISPERAMVEIISKRLKQAQYVVLQGMRSPSTVHSVQGQESDMVVIVTGTNSVVGAGFTSDERRLNVMLSRHKSALVIFSDIDTVDYNGKSKAELTQEPTGEMIFTKATMLKRVHSLMVQNGRVATVDSSTRASANTQRITDINELFDQIFLGPVDGDTGHGEFPYPRAPQFYIAPPTK
ncbi:hypothetical protein FVEN_g9414 [Fusarium venenatum]|nr:hypothetical protein FVEN_g9414 [Fusarium venenatum]